MSNEKPADRLDFLSLKDREKLQLLAKKDKRDEFGEIAWLIEMYADGRLVDVGEETVRPPRVSLASEVRYVEGVRFPQPRQSGAQPNAVRPSGSRDE